MTERLREEMLRIGETASPASVGEGLWAQGRRARRRDRLVAVTAVCALLAVLGGVGWLVTSGSEEPGPVKGGSGDGAVPSMIYGVPFELMDDGAGGTTGWDSRIAEKDLTVGRASVAYLAEVGGSGLPVVVTAGDGRLHPLVLPGWVGAAGYMQAFTQSLALSPDGTQLAYGWWDPDAQEEGGPMPAGVRVLDLETGDIRSIPLTGGEGIQVRRILWSPDGRWLLWMGHRASGWTEDGIDGGVDHVAGRIAPGATEGESVPISTRSLPTLAIADDGRVAIARPEREWRIWDGQVVAHGPLDFEDGGVEGAWSPEGDQVALGTRHDAYEPPDVDRSAWFLDLSAGRVRERPLAAGNGMYPTGIGVRPLGWLDADSVVAMVTPASGVGGSRDDVEIVVMTAPSRPRAEWTYRIVGHLGEQGALDPDSVTVAVDLMTHQHPTAEFPEPEWPMSDERKRVLIGVAVASVLVLLYVGLVVRQRIRRTRAPRRTP